VLKILQHDRILGDNPPLQILGDLSPAPSPWSTSVDAIRATVLTVWNFLRNLLPSCPLGVPTNVPGQVPHVEFFRLNVAYYLLQTFDIGLLLVVFVATLKRRPWLFRSSRITATSVRQCRINCRQSVSRTGGGDSDYCEWDRRVNARNRSSEQAVIELHVP